MEPEERLGLLIAEVVEARGRLDQIGKEDREWT
jgi:hypothetical protein